MDVTRKADESSKNMNPNSKTKTKTKTWIVVVAFFCCFVPFCFYAFCFWYQYYINCDDDSHGRARMDTLVYLTSFFPIVSGGCALCVKVKSAFLTRRMNKQNLVGAYMPDEHGDLEKGVVGTDFHREAAMDMTMFSFACWVVGYPIALFLPYYLGWFEFMPSYIFKGIMASIFGTSALMSLRVLIHTCRKMNKLNQLSCCT